MMALLSLLIFTSILVKSCNSIVVPELKIVQQNKLIINDSTDQLKNLLNQFSCVDKFITNYMNQQRSRITVVLTDNHTSDISYFYLKQLQKNQATFVLNKYSNASKAQKALFDVVIIMKNHTDLLDATIKLNEICGRNGRYAVLLINIFNNIKLFIEEAKILIQLLWIKRVSRVVIIGSVKDDFFAAESDSFESNILCKPMDPVIVDKCQNGTWKYDFFMPIKMNNCSVTMGYYDHEPYSHLDNETLTGIEVSMIKIIQSSLNFTINPMEIVVGSNETRSDSVTRTLTNRTVDFLVGGIIWRPAQSTDFIMLYEMVQFVFLVPIGTNFSVGGLISPLQNTVWMAVGGVLLFSVFLRLTLFRKISFLEILAVVIGVAWNKQPIRLSYRIKFMSWIIFGYILCQFYLATMAGNLMSRPVEKMDTFEDLVMSNKMLGGSKLSPTFFKRVQGTSEKFDNLSKLMMKRFITFERDVFRKKLLDLMNGKNKSLALSTLLNTTSASHNYDTSIVRKLPEVLSSVSLSIAAWRGLPCVSRIEKKLRQLKWAGIASHLGDMEAMKNQIRQETNNDKDQSMENSFIELSDLIPGFLLMMLGYSIGLLCLFCEIIYYKFTGSRKNYRSKRKVRIRKIKY
ncbi:uncharacterized protein LOC122860460 [Aphidius gifuensis]|uniref:Ionotropic receptor n=1 Tax=Aphidius gifuensis TaxID=684658 RepID=A0A3S5HST5_APHGI|nr:uncharacterized protein LOC122860460 [Aphidius gifuensis]AZQ24975.1 ionotropic receptor [Aphidius gifuensis]